MKKAMNIIGKLMPGARGPGPVARGPGSGAGARAPGAGKRCRVVNFPGKHFLRGN